jgi:plastocyanin domain-containing protein
MKFPRPCSVWHKSPRSGNPIECPLEVGPAMTSAYMRCAPLALIALLSCKQQTESAGKSDPIREVSVTSKGFEPDHIDAAPGQQLVLRITRKEKETCADAVEVEGDPVRHMLPMDKAVDVKVTAPQNGELAFACPMNMVRGAIVVR